MKLLKRSAVQLYSLVLLNPAVAALHFIQPGTFNIAIVHSVQTRSHTDSCQGPVSPTRFSLTEVVRRTIERINRDSHLLPNVPLGFIFIDACGSARKSLHEAVRLLAPAWQVAHRTNWTTATTTDKLPVIGVVGGESTESTSLLSTYLQLYKLPLVSITTMPDELSNIQQHPYLFRLVPNARKLGYIVSLVLRHFKWTYVTVIHDSNSVTKDMFYSLQRNMRRFNLCFGLRETVPTHATIDDFKQILNRVLKYVKNGRVIILFLSPGNARSFMASLKFLGLTKKFILIWTDTVHSASVEMSEGGNGSLWLTAYFEKSDLPRILRNLTYFQLNGNPWASEYWKKIYRCRWDYRSARSCLKYSSNIIGDSHRLGGMQPEFDQRAFMIEVAVETFAKALHNAITVYCPQYFSAKHLKSSPDICITGTTMMAALRSLNLYVNNANRKSIHYSFDQYGDLATSELQIKQLTPTYPIDSNASSSSFYSPVGHYYSESDSLDVSRNQTFWWQKEGSPVSVCSRKCGPNEAVIWRSSCCWNCLKCPTGEVLSTNKTRCFPCPLYTWPNQSNPRHCSPLDVIDFSSFQLMSSVNGFLGICGLTISFCIGICLVKWRREKLFRLTGFLFHLFLLICIAMLFAHTLSYARPPQGIQCVLRQAVPALLFTVIYGSLLASSIRVYLVLQASTRMHHVQSMSQAVLTAIILFIVLLQALLVSTVYSLHGMPQTKTSILPVRPRPFLEIHCSHTPISLHLPIAYHTALLLTTVLLSCRTRRLPNNAREALALSISTGLSLVCWTVFFILREVIVAFPWQGTLLHLLHVHVNAFVLLIGLFLPKLCALACAAGARRNGMDGGNFDSPPGYLEERHRAALAGMVVRRWYKGRLTPGRYVSEEVLSIRDRPRELHESSI